MPNSPESSDSDVIPVRRPRKNSRKPYHVFEDDDDPLSDVEDHSDDQHDHSSTSEKEDEQDEQVSDEESPKSAERAPSNRPTSGRGRPSSRNTPSKSKEKSSRPRGRPKKKVPVRTIENPPPVSQKIEELLEKEKKSNQFFHHSAKAWGKENLKLIQGKDFAETLPKPLFDQNWTRQDEKDLKAGWRKDPMRVHLIDYKGNKPMLALWKACLALFGCHPFNIISPEMDLAHDVSENATVSIGEKSVRNPRMSDNFCRKLKTLVTHPFFAGSAHLLALCIQYAVICRTNHRGEWRPLTCISENDHWMEGFTRFLVAPGTQDVPVPELHQLSIVELREQFGSRPTITSRVFSEMEKLAWNEDRPITRTSGPFLVRSQDLSNVIEALDTVSTYGAPVFRPANILEQHATNAYSFSVARRQTDLENAVDKILLARRRNELMEWQANREPTSSTKRANSGFEGRGRGPTSCSPEHAGGSSSPIYEGSPQSTESGAELVFSSQMPVRSSDTVSSQRTGRPTTPDQDDDMARGRRSLKRKHSPDSTRATGSGHKRSKISAEDDLLRDSVSRDPSPDSYGPWSDEESWLGFEDEAELDEDPQDKHDEALVDEGYEGGSKVGGGMIDVAARPRDDISTSQDADAAISPADGPNAHGAPRGAGQMDVDSAVSPAGDTNMAKDMPGADPVGAPAVAESFTKQTENEADARAVTQANAPSSLGEDEIQDSVGFNFVRQKQSSYIGDPVGETTNWWAGM